MLIFLVPLVCTGRQFRQLIWGSLKSKWLSRYCCAVGSALPVPSPRICPPRRVWLAVTQAYVPDHAVHALKGRQPGGFLFENRHMGSLQISYSSYGDRRGRGIIRRRKAHSGRQPVQFALESWQGSEVAINSVNEGPGRQPGRKGIDLIDEDLERRKRRTGPRSPAGCTPNFLSCSRVASPRNRRVMWCCSAGQSCPAGPQATGPSGFWSPPQGWDLKLAQYDTQ